MLTSFIFRPHISQTVKGARVTMRWWDCSFAMFAAVFSDGMKTMPITHVTGDTKRMPWHWSQFWHKRYLPMIQKLIGDLGWISYGCGGPSNVKVQQRRVELRPQEPKWQCLQSMQHCACPKWSQRPVDGGMTLAREIWPYGNKVNTKRVFLFSVTQNDIKKL